jgi:transposase InsO family protein
VKDKQKADEIATQRMQLVAPLLAEGLDAAKAMKIRNQICEQSGISDRTLRRYVSKYHSDGFLGLRPNGKTHDGLRDEAIPKYILEQAIVLRREVPTRSVSQIIQILEWEGISKPGQIKRSTLQEKLLESGYSTRHMRMYTDSGVSARRFQRKSRNSLWHSDIKFGPYLPVGPNGDKKQVYLVTFMDDATRFILHGEFYPTLDQVIVEDCFRKALMKYGLPEAVYFDNGKQYRNKWMTRACSKLGVRLLFAKPYSPEATGKIERFNRVVDSFLNEAALERPQTLDKLNELFNIWTEECYLSKSHSALGENISPMSCYNSDSKPLKLVDIDTLASSFLHCEERKVDKAGCISFEGKKYEVGVLFIGHKVEVIYDPADTTILTIEHQGYAPWQAKELIIGERAGQRPKMPQNYQGLNSKSSRLLHAAALKNEQHRGQIQHAVSFSKALKGGAANV